MQEDCDIRDKVFQKETCWCWSKGDQLKQKPKMPQVKVDQIGETEKWQIALVAARPRQEREPELTKLS